jgi:hypothetical protein
MNAIELIDEVHRAGVSLTLADGDTVKLSGDEDAVKRLIPAIREHKTEIIGLLRGRREHAMHLARLAIARAALTPEQRASRIRDIEQTPEIAPFWAQMYRDDEASERISK